MSYYQARVSIETARLLEKMRVFYEKRIGGSVSKGDCLIMAYADSLWVEDWKEIFDEPMPKIENYEISQTAQLLKIQVTDDVRKGIQDLKETLPELLGTRSVTVGVCIREILKAAYIKNNDSERKEKIKNIFSQEINFIYSEFDENTSEKFVEIVRKLETKILNIIE